MPENDETTDTGDNATIQQIRSDRDQAVEEAKEAKRQLKVARTIPDLNDRQVSALLSDPDLDVEDEEAVKAAAVELNFVSEEEGENNEPPAEEEEGAEEIAKATSGGEPPASGVITPKDAAEWSTEKFARFQADHPEEADQLLQGEEVSGVTV